MTLQNRIISSLSLVSNIIGTASTPPRYLKSRALPSITGKPASGPISPNPKTRVPSLTIATEFPRLVCSKTFSLLILISLQGAATPGEYHIAKSSKERIEHFNIVSILPL